MKKIFLILGLLLLAFFSLFVGVQDLQVFDLLHLTETQKLVILNTRIPRMLSLLIAGATMSISGLLMQHLTQNKFVSPTTAGTMDSAKLGVLIAMLFFNQATILERMLVAFIFSLLGTGLFLFLLDYLQVRNVIFVPLIGLMFGSIVGSVATFLAYQYDVVQNVTSWMQGNFAVVNKGDYELIFIAIPLMLLTYLFAHYFTVAGMGEDFATNIGMNYKWIRFLGLVIVAVSTSSVLLTVGSIPFLGLIIPNLVSLYKGDHLKNSLLETAILGAAFLMICDIISRTVIAPYEVSVSLVVGVIGSVIFLYLLFRGEKSYATK